MEQHIEHEAHAQSQERRLVIPLAPKKLLTWAAVALGTLLVLGVIGSILLASLNSAREKGFNYSTSDESLKSPVMQMSDGGAYYENESGSYAPTPEPDGGYIQELETYETTDYSARVRTKSFDEACDTLRSLKSDTAVHFSSQSFSLNNCSAQFFVDEGALSSTLAILENIEDLELTESVRSVTRSKKRIDSRSDLLERQLRDLKTTLARTEVQFSEIESFSRTERDASALAAAVSKHIETTDFLNQRITSITVELESLYRQSAELLERIEVVHFSVVITRAYPENPGQYSQVWERAWGELESAFISFQTGLSAYFAVFILKVVQYSVYGLVLIFFVRYLYKAGRFIWKGKWNRSTEI